MSPQELSNLIWGFAKLGHKDETLVTSVLSTNAATFKDFNPQNLSNCLWGLAKLGMERRVLDPFWRAANEDLSHFNNQDLVHTLWSLAKSGVCTSIASPMGPGQAMPPKPTAHYLLPTICDALKDSVDSMPGSNVSCVLWSLSSVRYCPQSLIPKLEAAAERVQETMQPCERSEMKSNLCKVKELQKLQVSRSTGSHSWANVTSWSGTPAAAPPSASSSENAKKALTKSPPQPAQHAPLSQVPAQPLKAAPPMWGAQGSVAPVREGCQSTHAARWASSRSSPQGLPTTPSASARPRPTGMPRPPMARRATGEPQANHQRARRDCPW